jgi:hypothetical protein
MESTPTPTWTTPITSFLTSFPTGISIPGCGGSCSFCIENYFNAIYNASENSGDAIDIFLCGAYEVCEGSNTDPDFESWTSEQCAPSLITTYFTSGFPTCVSQCEVTPDIANWFRGGWDCETQVRGNYQYTVTNCLCNIYQQCITACTANSDALSFTSWLRSNCVEDRVIL